MVVDTRAQDRKDKNDKEENEGLLLPGLYVRATINEGVLPGFPVDKTIVIFISTINNRNNDQFFTRLLKRKDPDVGILLFSLRCEKCVESNRDLNVPCPHRIHFIPEVRP